MSVTAPRSLRWRLVFDYPFVSLTVGIAVVCAALSLTADTRPTSLLASTYALVIAVRSTISMLRSWSSGSFGIDILAIAAIGSTVALGDHWAALVVVLMLTSGEALEDFASRRARTELRALLDRAPRVAHRESKNVVKDIDLDAVAAGDLLEVRPGEAIPVDAELLTAGAWLDESSITGESLPVWRAEGSKVLSGAVNGSGVIRVRAVTTAAKSQYQTIVDLVRDAANSKAPFVRLADRISIPFTAGAFAIGTASWVLSGDATRLAEVLVVATPCPLLIATPVALIAGMSAAASRGIIVKSGGVMEILSRVRSAAFDKTGTLTRGTPHVERVDSLVPDRNEVLRVAAALEADSAHVLARAVVMEAERCGVRVPSASDIREVIASGIEANIDGQRCAVGKLSFVAPGTSPDWSSLIAGETAVNVSRHERLIGRIVLTDEVRSEAVGTIQRLRLLGVRNVVMLTGDANETAIKVASGLAIDDVRAGLLPSEKITAATALRPAPTLMVGDGVNDAPVLAAVDVGVAMGSRSASAASESADVVVLVDDLSRVADAVALSQRTMRIARQSIIVGIGLSVLLMLIASTGAVPAIVGATLQEVVDVLAIANSLRAGRSTDSHYSE